MTEEKNWAKLDGEVIKIIIEPNEYGLGLSLAGINSSTLIYNV